ncbi:MAG TPA: TIGR02594 family protein [Pseudolabrys sp.]|jgi:uncharacterized protein (TIGR02594 family)
MRLNQKRATILLCTVALAALSGSALARPSHHHRHLSANAVQSVAAAQTDAADRDARYPSNTGDAAAAASAGATVGRHHGRGGQVSAQSSAYERAQSHSNSAFGGFTNDALVSEARKYIGTNPTGRGSLWCGAFMDLVLKRTGHPGGGNLAIGYEHYGTRIDGPQVGAIAVMGRHGGGHVGVVTGIDANGNPIIVSGNHNHTVAESVYPRGRIAAYVVPGN